jgi:chemotaxis signal transduction protein
MNGDCTPETGRTDGLPMEPAPETNAAARGERVRSLLARPLPESELDENTRAVAAAPPAASRATATFLCFSLCGESLAFDTRFAARVVPVRTVRRIPHRGGEVLAGLANVGGELLPVARLERMLGLVGEPVEGPARRMIMVGGEGSRWAFAVDRVDGVRRFDEATFLPPPSTVARAVDGCTIALLPGPDGRSIALLDAGRIASGLERSLR